LRDYCRRLRSFSREARFYLLFTAISGFGFSVFYLLFNLYILSLGYGPEFLGLLVALPSFVMMLVALPAGLLGDRLGYRRTMLLGGGLSALALAGIGLWSARPGLTLCSLLSGLGSALAWVIGAPFMALTSTPEERTHLFSAQAALSTFSGFLGFLVGGSLPVLFGRLLGVAPESAAAYRAVILLSAGLLAVALLPVLAIREPQGSAADRPFQLRAAFQRPGLLVKLLAPEVLISLGAGVLIPFGNVFFKQRFAAPDPILGALFAGRSAFMGLAILAGPPLATRWGKVRAVVYTQLGSIPFLLLFGYAPLFALSALGFLVRAALMNLGGPLYSAFVMEQVEERRRGAVNGLLMAAWSGFWALGNWLSGQLQAGPGFGPIFAITCATYLIGSIMIYTFFARIEEKKIDLQAPAEGPTLD